MTASFPLHFAIAFSIATSICLTPPAAHGQSVPAAIEQPIRTGPTRTTHVTASTTKPSATILERSLGWSGGVLAVGAIALVISRKFCRPMGIGGESPRDQARISSRLQLTPRQALHVVRIGPRTLVIGTGPQGSPVTLAQWTAGAEEPGSDESDEDIRRLAVEAMGDGQSSGMISKNEAAA